MANGKNPTITPSQIAKLAGVRPSAVSNWRKRFDDFPRPVEADAGGREFFSLPEVEVWLQIHHRLDPEQKNDRLLFEVGNLLRGRRAADDGTNIIAAAIALAEAVDRLADIYEPGVSVDGLVDLVEEIDPTLEGVFEPLTEIDAVTADHILALVHEIEPHERGEVFEDVLRRRTRFTDTRTSDELISLLSQLFDSAESILDPAAGEGGFLAAATDRTLNQQVLYGQEVNVAAWRIAKQRFLLRQIEATLCRADSLAKDCFDDLRVAAVVCDPPYGAPNPFLQGIQTTGKWSFAAFKAKTTDFLWLEHAIGHLASDGRGYVLLPAGTLSRRGREAEVRAELIRRGAIDVIVSLPPGSAHHSATPLALWIVRRPGITAENPILLIDGSAHEGPSRHALDPAFTERIVEIVRHWQATESVDRSDADIAAAVHALELLGTDSNLLPSRWVHHDAPVDPAHRDREITEALDGFLAARNRLIDDASEVPTVDIFEPTAWIPVRELITGDVAEVIRGVKVKPEDCLPSGVRVLRTRDIREHILDEDPCYLVLNDSKPRPILTEPGDIVVSPASGKLRALVDKVGGHILASPLQALRFRSEWLDPQVAAAFLESPRNRRFAKGANWGYARVDLRDLELPLLPPEEAHRLRQALDQISNTEHRAEELAARARAVRETMLRLVGQPGGDTWT